MENRVLDAVEKSQNRKSIISITLIAVCTLLLFILLEMIRGYLPEILMLFNIAPVSTTGLILVFLVIVSSRWMTHYLNEMTPMLSAPVIVACVGLIIFTIEFLFKAIQNMVLMNNGLDLYYLQIIKVAGMVSVIGILTSIFRIRKLRRNQAVL